MNGAVGQDVVEPLSVLDIGISRVVADDKDKGGANLAILLNDIAYTALDIMLQLLTRGITVAPLRRVAVSNHLRTSVVEDGH